MVHFTDDCKKKGYFLREMKAETSDGPWKGEILTPKGTKLPIVSNSIAEIHDDFIKTVREDMYPKKRQVYWWSVYEK